MGSMIPFRIGSWIPTSISSLPSCFIHAGIASMNSINPMRRIPMSLANAFVLQIFHTYLDRATSSSNMKSSFDLFMYIYGSTFPSFPSQGQTKGSPSHPYQTMKSAAALSISTYGYIPSDKKEHCVIEEGIDQRNTLSSIGGKRKSSDQSFALFRNLVS